MLGPSSTNARWLRRWRAVDPDVRTALSTAAIAALLFLPYLGATGLWDPWETHYGEVARSMVLRRDWVFPYWESHWFFSKPPLTMWLQALGMAAVGALEPGGPLSRYTEWGMRLPFALLSITAVSLLSYAVSRIAGRRAGFITGLVLATMPMYFLLTRQTVTDTPFVTTMVCALACAIVAELDWRSQRRSAWWYACYLFLGLSTLAKGLLGVALPAAVLLLYAALSVLPWDSTSWAAHARWLSSAAERRDVREGRRPMPVLWAQLYRMRLGTGVLVFLAVALPWYLTLSLFDGTDEDGKTFFARFFIHDHFNRLGAGVHTTTPGGIFTYFIEQGGYAIFPWVAFLPGALLLLSRLRLRAPDAVSRLTVIAFVWAAFSFLFFSSSATKFHHYLFPAIPAVAVLIALFVDRLIDEGVPAHAVALILGGVLFALVARDVVSDYRQEIGQYDDRLGRNLAVNVTWPGTKHFTDLFVYNYERPYPGELVSRQLDLFGELAVVAGDLIIATLLALGLFLLFDAFRPRKPKSVPLRAAALGLVLGAVALLVSLLAWAELSSTLALGSAAVAVIGYLGWEARRAKGTARTDLLYLAAMVFVVAGALVFRGLDGPAHRDPLFVRLSQPVNTKQLLAFGFWAAGGLAVYAALSRAKGMLVGSVVSLAVAFALWMNWSHWVDLSHHWTQRDQLWRYYEQRRPDEPIAAFLMNWRGETFYSQNTVKQLREQAKLPPYLALPGRKWALVEHHRLPILIQHAQGRKVTQIDPGLNNKFVLVTIE